MKYITQKDRHDNTLSCSLLMYLDQKKSANAECAPRAAARGIALRAVNVLTSRQILREPLHPTSLLSSQIFLVHEFLCFPYFLCEKARPFDVLPDQFLWGVS